ncbi:cysteine desulfurase NifS [Clostridium algidicarnis]|uniref:Cysteine desulfurase IscS n=2 Tax=Clostridium algidicarnis TaxID=37659 RepID=A0A2S6G152_9CLOT|nr:cysteine desulfurase NifS [Clostridium algidicarnis]MBB6630557.1 cysteine desulfurase NifS [Clostridium algidicarnis]MBB6696296.1 cysteine desulfurase NifS [Clostridium algidicarnis]MBU3193515.1 cysteine desulfurase NifS [Clostridium algidicarnis]MBU3203079.1 cysteine desulfurase NifS [Clostridium algidicarnis]MBU3205623.1 cysteine desulfurase NifS [Clostridium algidicarnis]
MQKVVYMDYAATTYTKKEVLDEMIPYFGEHYGNPSSVYSISRDTRKVIDSSRDKVAKAINADRNEIFFTGGGTEADNFAIKGFAFANFNKGNHIITSKIEHHAVLHSCEYLEKHGFEITYLDVDEEGFINLEQLKSAIKDNTILVSIMFANNEIGTIQPIKEIGQICRDKNVVFHTDAVQAVGHIPIDVKEMNIDMLSLAAHKFYGPKGVGALYIKKGIKIDNLIHGGAQERGKRAGTENIAGIVGLSKALEMSVNEMDKSSKRLTILRDKIITGLMEIPHTKLNGPISENRLPGNVNVCFRFIEGEGILLSLDDKNICASSGSACTSGALDPSHVLLAIGLNHERAHGSLRLSIGDGNTEEEVDYLLSVVPEIIDRLRNMSPLWHDFIKKGEF